MGNDDALEEVECEIWHIFILQWIHLKKCESFHSALVLVSFQTVQMS